MTYQKICCRFNLNPVTFCLFFGLLYANHVNSQSVPVAYESSAVLQGDIQTFRIYMVNAFPFIPVTVNGTKGKFMFDTGNGGDIELNSNFIKLKPGKPLGKGNVASGQKFKFSRSVFFISFIRLSRNSLGMFCCLAWIIAILVD